MLGRLKCSAGSLQHDPTPSPYLCKPMDTEEECSRFEEQDHSRVQETDSEEEQMNDQPTGIKTNGVGKPVNWMNLTRSLADVDAESRAVVRKERRKAFIGRPPGSRHNGKIGYAGFDRHEVRVQKLDWKRG